MPSIWKALLIVPVAASLAAMPDCAADCLTTALANSPCTPTNTTCMCTNEHLRLDMTACATKSCTVKDSLVTKNLTMTSCDAPVRDRSGGYIAMSNVLAVVSALCVIQRFFSKVWWKIGLGLDDWFLLATFVVSIPSLIINVYGAAANGLGRDIWTVPFDQITKFGMYFNIMAVLYFAQVPLLKLALLFFYLRIFPTPIVRRLLWGTVVFNAVFGVVFVLVAIFQCQPISYFWTKWDGEHTGHCASINAITCSNAAISIAVDIWMLAVPLAQLKGLNLDWNKKIGVGLMFCVGTFVTVVSILRLQAVVRFEESSNATWDNFDVAKWSTIEISVGIICACMPTIRLLLVRLFPRILGTRRYAYASTQAKSLGTATVGELHRRTESGITCSRTYAVEFGDTDETHLVHMKDLDRTDPSNMYSENARR
ncbi:hypothetical protein AK830_g9309 [Neonectria ditissima]|uniref:CFEM domain-containing protein n=1 Tax=Neonectria ditissima TaxID=78410 RepID=A0A0P7B9B1_9HYPO|nr:hypothetical protein AK830_g9309 [Neonectria ditissima]